MPLIALYLLAAQMHDMHAGHEMSSQPDPFSLFNHHLAGVLVIILGAFTFLEESPFGRKHSWVKFLWPAPLILVALNVIFRGDSDLTWPIRLATIMPDTEAVQHKIFALVALAIAFIELFRRTGRLTHPGWRYIFYGLMLGGGIALLFHTGQHTAKIHTQHLWMGTWCIGAGVTKFLADLRPAAAWLRLYALPTFILALGFQLAFYVE